jgi:hypothetical protein
MGPLRPSEARLWSRFFWGQQGNGIESTDEWVNDG